MDTISARRRPRTGALIFAGLLAVPLAAGALIGALPTLAAAARVAMPLAMQPHPGTPDAALALLGHNLTAAALPLVGCVALSRPSTALRATALVRALLDAYILV